MDLLSSITGWEMSAEEIETTGERISAVRQMFVLREGIVPAVDFKLPDRIIGKPALKEGILAGRSVDVKVLSDEYYKSMGWDEARGVPTSKRLTELKLEDAAKDLDRK
jgi:aldehyde:ferredoxin oxidoreductase